MTESKRTAKIERKTLETEISGSIDLDGTGEYRVRTGLPFLDHMLGTFARHGRIDLTLSVTGDLEVDDHHTMEDTAIALATAFDLALGERRGMERFGDACIPMDEALVRCAIDLSGRPAPHIALALARERLGTVSCENIEHFFRSFANTLRCALHLDTLRGSNDHHKAEAAFKAFARAMRDAICVGQADVIPSIKGVVR